MSGGRAPLHFHHMGCCSYTVITRFIIGPCVLVDVKNHVKRHEAVFCKQWEA